MSRKLEAFTVLHHGVGGVGSGATVVVASSPGMARELVAAYLRSKSDGYLQVQTAALLEVQFHEESSLMHEPVPTTESGVVIEYHYPDINKPHEVNIVYIATTAAELAEELDRLQAEKNSGRGVSCVGSIVSFLRQGDLNKAKAVAYNESDKIRSYPDIVAVLKRVGFWFELSFGVADSPSRTTGQREVIEELISSVEPIGGGSSGGVLLYVAGTNRAELLDPELRDRVPVTIVSGPPPVPTATRACALTCRRPCNRQEGSATKPRACRAEKS